MIQIRKIFFFVGWIISLMWLWSCSDKTEVIPEPEPIVTISTDKTIIKANNRDEVVFSVTADGVDVTSAVIITQKGNSMPVEGNVFSTDSVASYTFFATYNNVRSNEISVEAIAIELQIIADKQTIPANNKDKVTFSILADDEDVTASAAIFQVASPDIELTEPDFSTKIPETYTFYAIYEGKKTNEINIEASAVIITLSVNKTSIKANNSDKATFTVKADDEVVTATSMIMQIHNKHEEELDGKEFLTDEAGWYTFYAVYDDEKSNEVTIGAEYVELAFLSSFSIAQITSTSCANCPKMADELKAFQRTMPGRIHVISLHPYGKYCYSELAGALAQTAISFADRAQSIIPPPPLAIVDLYDGVNLYPTTTGRQLSDAINRAFLARGRESLTGMAVRSKVNGSKIEFEVGIKTIRADEYRFFAFIVEDGVVHRQAMGNKTVDYNYIHDNVATYQLTEGDPHIGISLGVVRPGSETKRSFSIDTDKFNTGREVNLDNCRIVCYTLRSNDRLNYFVDNVTSCPVNGSVRYLYMPN